MPKKPDGFSWLDAKWLVVLSAFAAFVVVLDYDHRLGIAAGVLLALVAAIWIGLAVAFGVGANPHGSPVRALSSRFEEQARRRQTAAQRARDVSAKRSGPQ